MEKQETNYGLFVKKTVDIVWTYLKDEANRELNIVNTEKKEMRKTGDTDRRDYETVLKVRRANSNLRE